MDRLAAIPWARCSVGAEKVIESRVHPDIGELGTVRPAEIEIPEKESPEDDQLDAEDLRSGKLTIREE